MHLTHPFSRLKSTQNHTEARTCLMLLQPNQSFSNRNFHALSMHTDEKKKRMVAHSTWVVDICGCHKNDPTSILLLSMYVEVEVTFKVAVVNSWVN